MSIVALIMGVSGLFFGSFLYTRWTSPVKLTNPVALTIEAHASTNESLLTAEARKALLYNGDPAYLLPAIVNMGSCVQYHPRSGQCVTGWASVEMHRGYRAFGVFSDTYLPFDPNGGTNETIRQCAMFNALTLAVKSAWPFDGPPECAIPVTVDGAQAPFLSRFVGRQLAKIKLPPKQVLIVTTHASLEALPPDTTVPTEVRDGYRIPAASVEMRWREQSALELKFKSITSKEMPVLISSIGNEEAFLDALRWRLLQELAGKNFW